MAQRKTVLSILALASIASATQVGCAAQTSAPDESVGTHDDTLLVAGGRTWAMPISVCWNPDPQYRDVATPAQRQAIRDAIATSWERVSGVRTTGWDYCANGGPNANGLTITTRVGRSMASIGKGSDNWLGIDPTTGPLAATAIHEFGHTLGFYHEQARADTPADCTDNDGDLRANPSGSIPVGAWDRDSIMNYCNTHWTDGKLSDTDIRGARQFYGGMRSKLAVFNNGLWSVDQNYTRKWDSGDARYTFGITGDEPVIAGEGHMLGVFNRSGLWSFDRNYNGQWDEGIDSRYTFGSKGDFGVVGYLAGKQETSRLAVFNNGLWSIDLNGSGAWDTGDVRYTFGSPGDIPVVGDFVGGANDTDKLAVFNNGLWSIDLNGDGVWDSGDVRWTFGSPGDQPVVGDWDGDGRDNIGVFNNGVWSLDLNGNGTWDSGDARYTFGSPGDLAIVTDR